MTGSIFPRSDKMRFNQWQDFTTTEDVPLGLDEWVRPDGTPIYEPVDARHPGWQRFTAWSDLGPYGEQLRGEKTKHVYISPDGSRIWNLAGSWRGKEGVILTEDLKGSMHIPFEQRYSAGPYMLGEELERTDYRKRVWNIGILVGPGVNYLARRKFPDTPFMYRMIEESWWADWPENRNQPCGFWGTFTRTHGWRYSRVRIGEAIEQPLQLDPTAFGNNCASWGITLHSEFPFMTKPAFIAEWRNDAENAQVSGRNHGVMAVANRGDWPQWPKFIIEGASAHEGDVTIQDGITDRMVPLPRIYQADGMILVDTDPAARTLTGEHDPADDTLFKQMIRNSEILDYLIGDITNADSGIPVGRRMPGGIGFMSQIPPKSVAHLKVTHTNPAAKITAVVPQWYKMGYS